MAIKDLTDSELIERISQKDYNAFNELWRRYDKIVVSIFQSLLRDKHLAEDAYQQLFMRIWQNSHNYRGGDVKSYLQGIARNIYKEIVRKNTRELPLTSFSEERQEAILSGLATTQHIYDVSNNGQLMEEIETKIQKFRENIPELHREILNLRWDNNLRWKEIAKRVGATEEVCWVIYNRLNTKIKNILKEYK